MASNEQVQSFRIAGLQVPLRLVIWVLTALPLVALPVFPHLSSIALPASTVRVALSVVALMLLVAPITALFLLRRLHQTRAARIGSFLIWITCFVPAAVAWSLILGCMIIGNACE